MLLSARTLLFPESTTGITADSVYDADVTDWTWRKTKINSVLFSPHFNDGIKVEKIFHILSRKLFNSTGT